MAQKQAEGTINIAMNSEGVKTGTRELAAHLESLNKKVSGLFKLEIFRTAVAGVQQLIGKYSELGNYVDDIRNASANFGIDTTAFQNIVNAAEIADVSREQLMMGFDKLLDKIGEMKNGGEEATKIFNKLGISAKQLESLSVDKSFLLVLDRIKSLGDPAKQINALKDVFGKSGGTFANLMQGGLEDRSSVALTPQQLKNIDEFNDAVGRVGQSLRKMIVVILDDITPSLTEFANNMQVNAKNVKELISPFKWAFDKIVGVIFYAASSITSVIEAFARGASLFLSWIPGIDSENIVTDFLESMRFALAQESINRFSGMNNSDSNAAIGLPEKPGKPSKPINEIIKDNADELQKAFDKFIADLKSAIEPLIKTPLMTLGEQLIQLQQAMQFQLINEQQFAGALGRLVTNFGSGAARGLSPILPGLSLAGSQEAADSVLRSRFAGSGQSDPVANLRRAIEEQKKIQERQEQTGRDALTELRGINGILQVIGVS